MSLSFLKWNWNFFFYIFHNIYLNFKCLPLRQAIKLPIFINKPKFLDLSGKIVINGPVSTGMIRLGFNRVPLYPKEGCLIQNKGMIIFNGITNIGNDSKLIVGKNGVVNFGERFMSTAALKIICYDNISFGEKCLIGWDNMFIDSDFHAIKIGGG